MTDQEKPTDPLEELRDECERFRYQHDACGECQVCIAVAAWEKERAGFEALMPHVDTIKELAALRVEVQAVEEEIAHHHRILAEMEEETWLRDPWHSSLEAIGEQPERLRKARMGA